MIKNSILTIAVLSLGISALAEDWTNWRGPNYNGATSGKNLPVNFSKRKHRVANRVAAWRRHADHRGRPRVPELCTH